MLKKFLAQPLASRVLVLFLSALGGWLVVQFPLEIAALCGGANVAIR